MAHQLSLKQRQKVSPPVTFISSPHPEPMWSTECCASEGQGGRKCLKEQPKVLDSSPGSLANVASWARAMGSGLPKGLVTGTQTILQSLGYGQRLATSGSKQGMPSPGAANVCQNWACDSLETALASPTVCPYVTHRHTCTWTHKTCPGTHSHIHSPTPTFGNLGGFSKEPETFTLQMFTHCHQVRAHLIK